MENEAKGTTIGAGISSSTEFDYMSYGANINFAKKTNNRSGEFSVKLQAYLDQVLLIYPIELRTRTSSNGRENDDYASAARNSFSASFAYSQIINQKLQVEMLADLIYQKGYLALPFHRVYFNDNTEGIENLPGTRFKFPLGFRANYFMGDKVIIRTFYRYYMDDWGLKAHTANIEVPIKLIPLLFHQPFLPLLYPNRC